MSTFSRRLWMRSLACVSGAAALGVFSVTMADNLKLPPLEARQRVDKLVRELANGPAEQRRFIVEQLYHFLNSSGSSEELGALHYFGYDFNFKSDGSYTMGPVADRNKVLLKAIPALIAQINDSEHATNKAWWILVNLQGHCPEPKRDVWERWWKESGRKSFEG